MILTGPCTTHSIGNVGACRDERYWHRIAIEMVGEDEVAGVPYVFITGDQLEGITHCKNKDVGGGRKPGESR